MSAIEALDGQLLELRRLIGTARALCYTGRPGRTDTMATRHEPPATADATPAHVKVKRSDGLDVEVAGSAAFVTTTLERVLTVLGIIQAPPPA